MSRLLDDEDGCHCEHSQLDYDYLPPTDVSFEKQYDEVVSPTSQPENSTLQFNLKSSAKDFIDVGKTFIRCVFQILNEDGSKPAGKTAGADPQYPAGSKVYPINYFSSSIFKNVRVFINNYRISDTHDLLPYKALFELFLSYNEESAKQIAESGLFYKDTKTMDEITHFEKNDEGNAGASRRFLRTVSGKSCEMIGRIHSDFFSVSKLLPGDLPISIEFDRSDVNFALMANVATTKYQIKINEINLYVHRVRLTDQCYDDIINKRSGIERPALKYPMPYVDMKYWCFGRGNNILQAPQLVSHRTLPKRMVFGLISQDALNGSLHKNPFAFKNYGVEEFNVKTNIESNIPFYNLETNFTDDNYEQAYMALRRNTVGMFANEGMVISRDDFKNGHALFVFDITTSGIDKNSFEIRESGSVSFTIKLKEQLAEDIVVICYLEYDQLLKIMPNNDVELSNLSL